jgi:hypothetical protein
MLAIALQRALLSIRLTFISAIWCVKYSVIIVSRIFNIANKGPGVKRFIVVALKIA